MEQRESNGNLIYDGIDADLAQSPDLTVHTRFSPEPSGYLHLGCAKAIMINYEVARKYGGVFDLRFDDTNPSEENEEYIEAIREDIAWLGAMPTGGVFYASDFFDSCYELAQRLIRYGKAYVCDLSADEVKEYRGTLTEPGRNSPFRDRSVEENLDLLERMKKGEFPDGSRTLRAKIDMSSPNLNMRDPVIYRIAHVPHQRHGDKWCIYPLYDFAHPIQDALEGISHSICHMKFAAHRPLYEWVVSNLGFTHCPKQREFGMISLTYSVIKKKQVRRLVESGLFEGWDDPRLPSVRGLRRRGYTPSSIREFIRRTGISKTEGLIDIEMLESCIREELNADADRRIAVLDPVKVVITNYPEDKVEYFDLPNNPSREGAGTRPLPFTREIWIEREDFALVPPPKFFRLKPGGEVRLMGAYIIRCENVIQDGNGNVTEIHCTADLEVRDGIPTDRKIKGTIHWLSAKFARSATVMLYEPIFTEKDMRAVPFSEYKRYLNPHSATRLEGCMVEPSLLDSVPGESFQFVRTGYFCRDSKHGNTFNRTVSLRDGFRK